MRKLTGKVVAVTGASKGIGERMNCWIWLESASIGGMAARMLIP